MNNKENNFKEINGGVTVEQISAWKNQHGRISEVRVSDPETQETHIGYFKRPDMKTMEAVSATSKTNELRGSQILFDNCWLGGSDVLRNDAIMKMEGMAALGDLFGKATHELKNL